LLTSFFELLLPGLRDARTPLVSGLVWLLFGWLLLTDAIPDKNNAKGFALQVYDVAGAVGSGSMVAALGVLAYVLGILGVTFGDAVRSGFTGIENGFISLNEWRRWQFHARRRREALRREVEAAAAEFEAAKDSPTEAVAKKNRLDGANRGLETIDRSTTRWGLLIHRTGDVASLVGQPFSGAGLTVDDLAETAIKNAWEKGVDEELRRRDVNLASSEILEHLGSLEDQLLRQDLGHNALDVLRALDQALYQAFDRERSEREFRIAVMPPVLAITIYVGLTLTPWAYVGAALCMITFLLAALRQSQETARVLNHVGLKGLQLPSVRAAEIAGHAAVREHLARSAAQAKKAGPSADS
jgi:hypothetical protein